MSFAAFSIMASAKANQRSNDDLLHLLRDLGIVSHFQPQNLRRQITTELNRLATQFLSLPAVTSSSDAVFVAFERRSRPSLLAIASAHGINVDRYTGTNEDLKAAIITHFATHFGTLGVKKPFNF
jgi:hypothetical protein